ncbi:cytochrome c biogenesis protein ResB [Actinomyces sp. MRS3W]|uniref:cytochrome c biogenesis protein ResB n=1 Tax=Actinomyces sp. MRS3W TaxID=2800796 RepID=UPI0028FD37B1|nr:cytochrome c biogenesis protein ResB [Actinomyces sp. MRS3W]MDU0348498.1 cytochrome c biogenesis protein ResB [Actinomyces sp. MRS3W]
MKSDVKPASKSDASSATSTADGGRASGSASGASAHGGGGSTPRGGRRPEPGDGGSAVDGLDDQVALSPRQLARRIYAFFYHKAVGLVLILLAGLLALLGAIFPQMPSSARESAEASAQWLEQVRSTLGGWTGILNTLGVFHMFTSIPFLVVMGLLAASIIACTAHRLPVIWKTTRHPRTHVTARFFDRARLRSHFTVPLSADAAFDIIRADARKHHLRVITDERGPGRNAYLDRHHWAPFGTVFAHIAFVVVMVGFVVSSLTGFRDEQFTLTVGQPKEVGHGTALVAEARSFRDTYYEDGSPKDYVADLVVYEDGQEVAAQEVRVNTPLSYGGVMFHQSYFGVSAVMNITDATGAEVLHDGVALEWTTSDKVFNYGHTTLPDGTVIYVVGSASGQVGTGIEPGQMRIELYQGDATTPFDAAVLDQGTPTPLGDYTVTFEREQQFTGMIVRRDPGAGIVWFGFGLLALGICITMFFPHQRLWVRVTDLGTDADPDAGALVQMASPDRRDSGMSRMFTDMAVRLSGEMLRHGERTDVDA